MRWSIRPRIKKVIVVMSLIGVIVTTIAADYAIHNGSQHGVTQTWTDGSLAEYFQGSGADGSSAASAFVFSGVTFEDVKWVFDASSRFVRVEDCTFQGLDDSTGITVQRAKNIAIVNCTVQGYAVGVLLDGASDCQVIGLRITACLVGIKATAGSYANTFSLNNFTANGVHAADYSYSNLWSLDTMGNYFDDYLTKFPGAEVLSDTELEEVFVGSIPYPVQATNGGPQPATPGPKDHHPLVHCPNHTPDVEINSPLEGQVFGASTPAFNVSVKGWLVSSVWYAFEGVPGNYTIASGFALYIRQSLIGSINQSGWATLSSGEVNVTFFARNYHGKVGTAKVTILKDIIAPEWRILAPANHSLHGPAPPSYAIDVVESDSVTFSYSIGESAKYPATGSGVLDATLWGAQPDGEVLVKFHARDELLNENSSRLVLYKDSTAPVFVVWFGSIGNNRSTFGVTPPAFTILVTSEAHFDSAWYVLSGAPFAIDGSLAGSLDSAAWGTLGEGLVHVTFYTRDALGSIATLDTIITKDITPPVVAVISPPEGYLFGSIPPAFWLETTGAVATWYSVDGGVHNYSCGLSGSIDLAAWGAVPNGTILIQFWGIDLAGNLASDVVTLRRDVIAPFITVTSPSPGSIFGIIPPEFTLSIAEAHLQSIWFSIDGGITNHSTSTAGCVSLADWDLVPVGEVILQFWARDLMANVGSASVVINHDLAPPLVDIVFPITGGVFGNGSVPFRIYVNDQALDRVWYQVGANPAKFFLSPAAFIEGLVDTGAWVAEVDGIVDIRFSANDTGGNLRSETVQVIHDSRPPIIAIMSPVNDSLLNGSAPAVSIYIVEPHLGTLWYSLGEDPAQYYIPAGTSTFILSEGAYRLINDGYFAITVGGCDTLGNSANISAVYRKDSSPPVMNLVPASGGLFGAAVPRFMLYLEDAHFAANYAYISVQGELGQVPISFVLPSMGNNATEFEVVLPSSTWNAIPSGHYCVWARYTDNAGNTGVASCTFEKDVDAPLLQVLLPSMQDLADSSAPYLAVACLDDHFAGIWYSFDGGATRYSLSGLNGYVDQSAWDAMFHFDHVVTLTIFANDTLGNMNRTEVALRCVPKPNLFTAMGGMANWLLLGIFIVAIVIAVRLGKFKNGGKR